VTCRPPVDPAMTSLAVAPGGDEKIGRKEYVDGEIQYCGTGQRYAWKDDS